MRGGTLVFEPEIVDPALDVVSVETVEPVYFEAGRVLRIAGSAGNDGLYRVAEVSEDGTSLVLADTDELADEVADGVTLTGSRRIQDTDRGLAGGHDVIFGNAGVDLVYGGKGDDRVDGGADADAIFGEAGFDEIFGGAGDDLLVGGLDGDFIAGGRPAYQDAETVLLEGSIDIGFGEGDAQNLQRVLGQADQLTRRDGSWLEDGFRTGQLVRVAGAGLAANDGTYRVLEVNDRHLTLDRDLEPEISNAGLSLSVIPELVFEQASYAGGVDFHDNGSDRDTLTRETGQWSDDGFAVGQRVRVSASAGNDGDYTIAALDGAVMTLERLDRLTRELGASDVVVQASSVERSFGSFLEDGFAPGLRIDFGNAGENDGTRTIAAISEDGLRLELVPDAVFAPAPPEQGATVRVADSDAGDTGADGRDLVLGGDGADVLHGGGEDGSPLRRPGRRRALRRRRGRPPPGRRRRRHAPRRRGRGRARRRRRSRSPRRRRRAGHPALEDGRRRARGR